VLSLYGVIHHQSGCGGRDCQHIVQVEEESREHAPHRYINIDCMRSSAAEMRPALARIYTLCVSIFFLAHTHILGQKSPEDSGDRERQSDAHSTARERFCGAGIRER
jgi:hypothetical protein